MEQKNRVPTLNSLNVRQKVWQHIRENAKKKDIFIEFVNGYAEHCHCLVSLGADQTIQKLMQLIKGDCTFWYYKQQLTQQEHDELMEKFGFKNSRVEQLMRNFKQFK